MQKNRQLAHLPIAFFLAVGYNEFAKADGKTLKPFVKNISKEFENEKKKVLLTVDGDFARLHARFERFSYRV